MKLLDRLLLHNIPVSWGTLLLGWRGPKGYPRLISLAEIASFATNFLGDTPESSREIGLLSSLAEGDDVRCSDLLQKLAVGYDPKLEERKWRLALLQELLQGLDDDPLYGTIDVLEFWKKWDFPENSPLGSHGSAESLSAEAYTPEAFDRLISVHNDWLREEIIRLQEHTR